jgi:predicted  nucleic acid-binding Zn-ribbon protein
MKGVKTMSLANATSKRFQSDDIITQRVHLPDGLELVETLKQMLAENKKLTATVSELQLKLKELEDKVNSFETEIES